MKSGNENYDSLLITRVPSLREQCNLLKGVVTTTTTTTTMVVYVRFEW